MRVGEWGSGRKERSTCTGAPAHKRTSARAHGRTGAPAHRRTGRVLLSSEESRVGAVSSDGDRDGARAPRAAALERRPRAVRIQPSVNRAAFEHQPDERLARQARGLGPWAVHLVCFHLAPLGFFAASMLTNVKPRLFRRRSASGVWRPAFVLLPLSLFTSVSASEAAPCTQKMMEQNRSRPIHSIRPA